MPQPADRRTAEAKRKLCVDGESDAEEFVVEAVCSGVAETLVIRGELDIATTPLFQAVIDSVHMRRLHRLEIEPTDPAPGIPADQVKRRG